MQHIRTVVLAATTRLHMSVASASRRAERGDVPGWVLVTLMTAGIVAVIWGLAQEQLKEILDGALDNVQPNN
jgi:hypothetical protein